MQGGDNPARRGPTPWPRVGGLWPPRVPPGFRLRAGYSFWYGKINIYSPVRPDPRITQISSVFVSSLFCVADLEQDVVLGICGGEQPPSSLSRSKC